ncbi:MAG TPA: hypothetical protein VMH39_11425 [Gemmatimonadaceae bacterium]|nr:hypothetical protein [Gemmatimonadaceae bacterium]
MERPAGPAGLRALSGTPDGTTSGTSNRGMKRTEPGLRSQIARRIIKQAYGIDPKRTAARIVRYELIGESVAVVVLREDGPESTIEVRVAQRLTTGRVIQLEHANRCGLRGYREIVEHLEALYHEYGTPKPH